VARPALLVQLVDDALGDLAAGARVSAALSRIAMADARSAGLSVDSTASAGADALHCLQQAELFALGRGGKAEQTDLVLSHMGLDRKLDRLARSGQRLSIVPLSLPIMGAALLLATPQGKLQWVGADYLPSGGHSPTAPARRASWRRTYRRSAAR
jgi:hypothetical protein